jgi:hypothetical protein
LCISMHITNVMVLYYKIVIYTKFLSVLIKFYLLKQTFLCSY